MFRWGVALGLFLFFVLCAWSNLDNIFQWSRKMRERRILAGSRVSPAMLVGGIAGAIALWLWPEPDLHAWWWVPFLVDFPGTLGIGRAGDVEAHGQEPSSKQGREVEELGRQQGDRPS